MLVLLCVLCVRLCGLCVKTYCNAESAEIHAEIAEWSFPAKIFLSKPDFVYFTVVDHPIVCHLID